MSSFVQWVFFLFLLAVICRTCNGASEKCSSDRPWASNRTLLIPENRWGGLEDNDWVDAFCCVYTHVEAFTDDIAKLITYDNSTLEIEGDSFIDIAEAAMAEICSMSMGADDCEQQKSCVNASRNRNLNIDGGKSGWDKNSWSVTVDGVMGGKSTGNVEFENNYSTMIFSGAISLVGGGFSSVRRPFSPSIDMRPFAGIVVEVMATDNHGQEGNNQPPLGIHLQLHDSKSRWGFAAAFAIPLASKIGVVSSVFIPMKTFDRGSSIGYQCKSCSLDLSSINGMDFYVLFQDRRFELQVKSITAVEEEHYFGSPQISFASNELKNLLESTIKSAGYLYDLQYVELCIAVYSATLNAIVKASDGVPQTMKSVACDGLRLSSFQTTKKGIAWELRYTADALLADLAGVPRNEVQGWFLPYPSFYEGEYLCMDMGHTTPPTSHTSNDLPSKDRFDGPFTEGEILEIDSSNELGRSYTKNSEECARLCLMHSQCLSFYFSRQLNFGGECRFSTATRSTVGVETSFVEATFRYDYYERNFEPSMDEPRPQLENSNNVVDKSSPTLDSKTLEKCVEEPCGSLNDESMSTNLFFHRKLKIMFTMLYAVILYL